MEIQGTSTVFVEHPTTLAQMALVEFKSIIGDPEGILPSQFYEVSERELGGDEKLHFASLMLCVEDWIGLFKPGAVSKSHEGRITAEDAMTLHDFLFSDHHGDGSENFV